MKPLKSPAKPSDKPPANPLNRRAFLKASSVASAVTAGALCGPAWLRDAFALNERQVPKATDSLATLSTAYRAAERAGKPLVILVIPEDPMARWERGTLFGEYLTHAADDELAPLALAEVTCARRATARLLLPMLPAPDAKEEPLFLVAETTTVPATVQTLAAPGLIPDLPRGMRFVSGGAEVYKQCQDKKALVARWRKELGTAADEPLLREVLLECEGKPAKVPGKAPADEAYALQVRSEESLVNLRIRTLARLFERALAPDLAALQRRSTALLARLPAEQSRAATLQAQSAQALAQLPLVEADRLAALLMLRAAEEQDAKARVALRKALAQAAAVRLRQGPVSGSRWARSGGCGTTFEDEKDDRAMMVACGMGHVPAKSARFLYFFTGGV